MNMDAPEFGNNINNRSSDGLPNKAPFKTNFDDRFNDKCVKRPSTPPPY